MILLCSGGTGAAHRWPNVLPAYSSIAFCACDVHKQEEVGLLEALAVCCVLAALLLLMFRVASIFLRARHCLKIMIRSYVGELSYAYIL